MQKSRAIEALGGSVQSAASKVGVSSEAVRQWPDPLPARIADRVLAALAREHLPPHLIARLMAGAEPAEAPQA